MLKFHLNLWCKKMKWENWLKKWEMSLLRVNAKFLQMEFKLNDSDRKAAWELYIELLTKIITQPLAQFHGNEKTALNSIFSIFSLTRSIIKENGTGCIEFTKIAIIVLNQIIRPFTAKWHKLSIEGAFQDKMKCQEFRDELTKLQQQLCIYSKMLADMAGVEDLTDLEKGEYNVSKT